MIQERQLGLLLSKHHFDMGVESKMVFLVGPRQCGKTTLARFLQTNRLTPELYRNWDDILWRREISANPYGFFDNFRPIDRNRPLVVFDEIHKFPRWKEYLKGFWDTRSRHTDVLVTGSGRLDIYRRGGDSLMGRYHQYRLHPLTMSEISHRHFDLDQDDPAAILAKIFKNPSAPTKEQEEAFKNLLRWGGFPEPFFAGSERRHRLWVRERRERLIREDMRDLTRIQMLSSLEQLAELLVLRAGSLISLNNLREDLGVSMDAIRLWMASMERLYYCFRVSPFAANMPRALRREPKVYLYDWSEISSSGARLENLAAMALLKWCHFTQDWGQKPLELFFVRDKEKREVDFLLTLEKRPFLLIEVKQSDRNPGPAMEYFSKRLDAVPRILLVADLKEPGRSRDCLVLPMASFLSQIP